MGGYITCYVLSCGYNEDKTCTAHLPQKPCLRLVRVQFLADVPTFVGIDSAIYGPYRAGEKDFIPHLHYLTLLAHSLCVLLREQTQTQTQRC